jgi:hypothetical protein
MLGMDIISMDIQIYLLIGHVNGNHNTHSLHNNTVSLRLPAIAPVEIGAIGDVQ